MLVFEKHGFILIFIRESNYPNRFVEVFVNWIASHLIAKKVFTKQWSAFMTQRFEGVLKWKRLICQFIKGGLPAG